MLHARLHAGQVRALLLAASIAAAATSLSPATTYATTTEQTAGDLARAGQHEAAAQAYERQAKHFFRAWDTRPALLAAHEYVLAGRNADAERVLGKVSGRASGDDAVLLARIQAELALAKGDGDAALLALAAVPGPWPAPLATELLLLQARAFFMAGKPLEGVRTLEERGRLLGTPEARSANYRLLVRELQKPGVAETMPPGSPAGTGAWLELAQILAEASRDEQAAARRGAEWQTRNPGHPGSELLPKPDVAAAATAATGFRPLLRPGQGPATVALVLPLSGQLRAIGEAVRDGFVAATLAQRDAAPGVLVYDAAELGVELAYRNAVADGAGIVVGPLTREDVGALVAKQSIPVPTLVLNSPGGETTIPAFMYEFTLDPEHEARAAARRIVADGHTRGIALFPRTAWGERVFAAFTAELQATGGVLLTTQYYDTGTRDFSGPLKLALGRYAGAAESQGSRDAIAEARDGPQFAFVAANAANARALIPQLRFQMTYALPVYATSDAWDPSVQSAPDMDGLEYPEFPWILHGGDGAPLLWDVLHDEWATSGRGRLRLYGFGHDAAVLASNIWSGRIGTAVDGLSGRLQIGDDGRVRRDLDWAEIVNGTSQSAARIAAPSAGAP